MSDIAHPEPGRPDPRAEGAVLARLFEQHGRTVYGLCRLLLRDPTDAEDAAQQTFLSAHRALVSGVVPRDGGAWLATIARNECRNRVRSRMREPLMVGTQFIGASEPLEETAARAEQIAELKAALLDLPEKQREAVLLRDVYGLRYGEIATAIGATRPAVEALLFRARRRLQGRLRPLRDAAATVLVPAPLRDALADAIPGFAAGGGGAAGAAVGLTAAKLATATVLVGAAGTTVAVVGSSDRAQHAPRPPARVATAEPVARAPELAPRIAAKPVIRPAKVVEQPVRAVPRVEQDDDADEARGRDNSGRGNDDDRSEERGSSSGPGPGVREEKERDEHAERRNERHNRGKGEAKTDRHKEKGRKKASHDDHSGRGRGHEDEDEDRSGRGGGDESGGGEGED